MYVQPAEEISRAFSISLVFFIGRRAKLRGRTHARGEKGEGGLFASAPVARSPSRALYKKYPKN